MGVTGVTLSISVDINCASRLWYVTEGAVDESVGDGHTDRLSPSPHAATVQALEYVATGWLVPTSVDGAERVEVQ